MKPFTRLRKVSRRDVLSPANALTLLGLILTIYGCLYLTTWKGYIFALLGRNLDTLDGIVARHTHTSEFGSMLDAIADKFAMVAILIATRVNDMVPVNLWLFFLLYNSFSVIINWIAGLRGAKPGAFQSGRLSMFLSNWSIGFFVLAYVGHWHWASVVAWTFGLVTIPISFYASLHYVYRARNPRLTE